ncbi:MAG TPA: hypothetical protein VMN36_17420 [Verrucomicrobiales bacterium]|nr:hypothetical protein [Verrucomicrobiales bacterium]
MRFRWLERVLVPGWILAAGWMIPGPAAADPPSREQRAGRDQGDGPGEPPRDGERRGRRPPQEGPSRMNREDWDRLRTLMEKAHATEAVSEAQKAAKDSFAAYRKLLNETILELDPSADALLAKVEERFGGRGGFPFNGGRPDRGRPDGPPFRLEVLSDQERDVFFAAWKGIGGDEKVAEFRRRMEKAGPNEDRRELYRNFREELSVSLVAADARMKDLIAKMDDGEPRGRDRDRGRPDEGKGEKDAEKRGEKGGC